MYRKGSLMQGLIRVMDASWAVLVVHAGRQQHLGSPGFHVWLSCSWEVARSWCTCIVVLAALQGVQPVVLDWLCYSCKCMVMNMCRATCTLLEMRSVALEAPGVRTCSHVSCTLTTRLPEQ
jgi:hypothetical protein